MRTSARPYSRCWRSPCTCRPSRCPAAAERNCPSSRRPTCRWCSRAGSLPISPERARTFSISWVKVSAPELFIESSIARTAVLLLAALRAAPSIRSGTGRPNLPGRLCVPAGLKPGTRGGVGCSGRCRSSPGRSRHCRTTCRRPSHQQSSVPDWDWAATGLGRCPPHRRPAQSSVRIVLIDRLLLGGGPDEGAPAPRRPGTVFESFKDLSDRHIRSAGSREQRDVLAIEAITR